MNRINGRAELERMTQVDLRAREEQNAEEQGRKRRREKHDPVEVETRSTLSRNTRRTEEAVEWTSERRKHIRQSAEKAEKENVLMPESSERVFH